MKKKHEIVFGTRAIIEALQNGKEINKVLLKHGLRNDRSNNLINTLKKRQIPFQFVPIEKLNHITSKNHQGAIAYISPIEYTEVEQLLPSLYESGEEPLFLLLDGITDVRNFGAIARTAECAGVHGIIIPAKGAAQINADAIKTSAGALLTLPICRTENMLKTLQFLKNSGLTTISATEKTNVSLYEASIKGPCAIVMGSEEKGIHPRLLNETDFNLKIPLKGHIASLNVSAATSVFLYEISRQREMLQQ